MWVVVQVVAILGWKYCLAPNWRWQIVLSNLWKERENIDDRTKLYSGHSEFFPRIAIPIALKSSTQHFLPFNTIATFLKGQQHPLL